MTKRGQWVAVCLLWTVIWGVIGILVWPFLFFAAISLSLILLPVGVPDTPSTTRKHNPDEWTKHGQ